MSLRKGIVVAVHASDHSVDLVMVDDGSRKVGVQVQSPNASGRAGTVDLPDVPTRKNKWDITEKVDWDVHATVDMIGRNPVVTGFIYPQVNKMLSSDPKVSIQRTKSDVLRYDDGNGNFGIVHPGGAFIAVGSTPDVYTFPSMADGAMAPDRNTDQKTYMRVSLGGQAVDIVMSPGGDLKITLKKDFTLECQSGTVKATEGLTFDSPTAHFTGEVTSDGDMIAGTVSVQNHVNTGVQKGGDNSGPPAK